MPTTRSNKHTTSSADAPMVVTTIAVNTTTTTSNTAGLGTIVDATSPSYATPPDIPGAHGITTIAPSVSKANPTLPTTVLAGNVPQSTIGTSPGNVPILNPAPGMVPPASSAQLHQYFGYGLGSVPQYGQALPTYPNNVNHAPTTQLNTTPSHHPVLAPPAPAGPPGQPATTTAVGEEDATPSRVIQFMRSQTRLNASHEHDIHEQTEHNKIPGGNPKARRTTRPGGETSSNTSPPVL
ncbi:mucin-5AC-like [Chrysoperla carnea]|uniref:mucin-5AC-like n=1 Tax=Chrysoperla carnea TaxID=189513 RepID=UPI001D0788F5|nr:mucin-5AC-like [Chrysoperla carnea]XP_044742345.1 mucin-5AC-like [Chrysoperla carnea]